MINYNEKKFLVDAMLGTLAKKLRLMGFDSKYFQDKSDKFILEITKKENRILVTKDKELVNKAKKFGNTVVFITKSDEFNQFLEIKNKLNLKDFIINGNISRCTLCNGELATINKNTIIEKIPKKVAEYKNDFWKCTSCSKIYWEGTHIINLQNFVRRMNEKQ